MSPRLLRLDLLHDRDIVAARQRARQISALLGFDTQDQVRIATAVSELARNALRHGGGGAIEFNLDTGARPPGQPHAAELQIVISDHGPGIPDLDRAMREPAAGSGELKLGLVAARRLMDSFDVSSGRECGTAITLGKFLSRRTEAFTPERIAAITDELTAYGVTDATAEMQQQNRDLLRSLEELRLRKEELARLNAELEDTNRGVMALYAELEERAAHLRSADETKTRFLSAVSHEFRTPVNSILALSKILLHRLDGELSGEQEKQVSYIRQAAEQLSIMVDDLLDLRKVESGKLQLRFESFTVEDLFGALRGMFKPLNVRESVALIFEDAAGLPQLHTDQGKVSQILRNLISNALKFTEHGSVHVAARLTDGGRTIVFSVADTGVGIAPENYRRVFDEFTQVENPLQAMVKGTGLGLPLSQRLAGLLGGSIDVASQLGRGSVFSLAIPLRLAGAAAPEQSGESATQRSARSVLIIDDSEVERYALRQFLASSLYEVIEAPGGYEGLRLARQSHPDLIFLDLAMPDVHGLEVLKMLKAIDETRNIPVVLFTSQRPDDIGEEQSAAASALLLKNELSRESVAAVIRRASAMREESIMQPPPETILNVNDNEPGRYATTRILSRAGFQVVEAGTGIDALRLARSTLPPLVILDINLPDMSGVEVCRQLKADPQTAATMVLQVSATNIAVVDRVQSLSAGADSFLVEPVEPEELEAVTRALLRLHRSESALRRSLAEREMLLREVNHRVKNSLQLVLSMLSLQGNEFREAGAKELFAKAIARVTAIASIHERLYQDNDPLSIDMQTYLNGLCAELARAGIGDERHADLRTGIEPLRLPTENGVSLALIVNELVMNALKHGRPRHRPAIVYVSLKRLDPNHARLTIADNGSGLGAASQPPSGLGTRLIGMLVQQLRGQLEIEDSANGYAAHVTFPLDAPLRWEQTS